ncbi:MAG TPA: hypothetical protein EYQ50_28390 [Verrucomicrobiales bacterium]|nr:hypothetical protein [Verrucomicrobiales bacterium]
MSPSDNLPNELWWERELLRNEKIVEQVLDNWDEELSEEDDIFGEEETDSEVATDLNTFKIVPATESTDIWEIEEDDPETELDIFLQEDVSEEDPLMTDSYLKIAKRARNFAAEVFQLESIPEPTDILLLSAGKIGANLAGGHGLGYDDESICGNIVKCKWALSDCRFCSEMFDFWLKQNPNPDHSELLHECRELEKMIKDRINYLREKVWW